MRADCGETVWVVTNIKDDGHVETAVYCNESDAANFYEEMKGDSGKNVHMSECAVIYRDSDSASGDVHWGMLRMDISSEFVEGLLEEMDLPDNIKPEVAEKFVCEKIDHLRKKAVTNIEKIVKTETAKEIESSLAKWLETQVMED